MHYKKWQLAWFTCSALHIHILTIGGCFAPLCSFDVSYALWVPNRTRNFGIKLQHFKPWIVLKSMNGVSKTMTCVRLSILELWSGVGLSGKKKCFHGPALKSFHEFFADCETAKNSLKTIKAIWMVEPCTTTLGALSHKDPFFLNQKGVHHARQVSENPHLRSHQHSSFNLWRECS